MKISKVKISKIASDPTSRLDAQYWTKEKPLRIKVRFNLGRGKHYMKWKIQSSAGVEYYSPEDVDLVLKNCQLKNNRKVAERIFNGENKDVCAWIICDSVEIVESKSKELKEAKLKLSALIEFSRIRYNPRIHPYWTILDECVDNNSYDRLYTIGKRIFISSENN
jgi:hypothetical protein